LKRRCIHGHSFANPYRVWNRDRGVPRLKLVCRTCSKLREAKRRRQPGYAKKLKRYKAENPMIVARYRAKSKIKDRSRKRVRR
jgi:hypothetical protein